MAYLLSCDWGTSSFRLRLVEAENAEIIAVKKSDQGIAAIFNSMDKSTKADPERRLLYYLHIIKAAISKIEQEENADLEGVPLLISGMASSSIGMAELPYRKLPFSIVGKDIEASLLQPRQDFSHPVLMISGVRSEVDVMRGEETQLIGFITDSPVADGEGLYIFPGTHSKHIIVKGRQVTGFRTYMTGEFFELLLKQSILKVGVEQNDELQNPDYLQCFKDGVQDAKAANLLHTAFLVRTNDLFRKLTKKENYHYLSGLLIGAELKEISGFDYQQVYVCSDSNLRIKYQIALEVLGLKDKVHVFPDRWADEAVVRGQVKVFKHYTQHI